jgi:hypothetical protein
LHEFSILILACLKKFITFAGKEKKMRKQQELKKQLKQGQVYRRAELVHLSNAVDRHLAALVKEGFLEKLSAGVYYVPKKTAFGVAPPDEEELVRSFLKDDNFLLTSPNAYNSLGVGTTQLYNKRVVYNHKRHGEFTLGGRNFFFHVRHRFPKKLTKEFLLIDLVNNLENLAEDKETILRNVVVMARSMDARRFNQSLNSYGNVRTKVLLAPAIQQAKTGIHASQIPA